MMGSGLLQLERKMIGAIGHVTIYAGSCKLSWFFAVCLFAYSANAAGISAGPGAPQPRLNFVNVQNFGAKCDGRSDDAVALNRALASGSNIQIQGNCLVIGATLTPHNNQWIDGGKGGEISFDASAKCAFNLVGLSNIHIQNVFFNNTTQPGNAKNFAVCASASNDIWVEHNKTVNVGLAFFSSPVADFATVDGKRLSHGSHVNYNVVGDGSKSAGQIGEQGIFLVYTSSWEAIGNVISGTKEGIQWWGGDSNVAANGAITNPRWNQNGHTSDNIIHDISGGCLWGSMGYNIVNTNNTVYDCGDVGFDDEGGVNVSFSGGSCRNAANGCLTTFWLPVGTVFHGIRVSQGNPGQPMYRAYNATRNPMTTSVTIENCVFTFTGPSGMGVVDTANGPVWKLIFQNNVLTNTSINFSGLNLHNVTIQGNHLRFTRTNALPFYGIVIADYSQDGKNSAQATIADNDVRSDVPQSRDSVAIGLTATDPNAANLGLIKNNRIFFPGGIDIRVEGNSPNAGIKPVFVIDSNVLGDATYSRVDKGAGSNVRLTGNRDGSDRPYD